MRIVESLAPFMGSWHGVNKLRLMPTDEYQDSVASATVDVTAQHFVTIAYTWSDGDQPQSGLLLLSGGSGPEGANAVWVDSWHSGSALMPLSGGIGDDGVVRLTGSYAAPPGPDWGWQIHIDPGDGNAGSVTMHNVVPGEAAYQVVEATYHRQGES